MERRRRERPRINQQSQTQEVTNQTTASINIEEEITTPTPLEKIPDTPVPSEISIPVPDTEAKSEIIKTINKDIKEKPETIEEKKEEKTETIETDESNQANKPNQNETKQDEEPNKEDQKTEKESNKEETKEEKKKTKKNTKSKKNKSTKKDQEQYIEIEGNNTGETITDMDIISKMFADEINPTTEEWENQKEELNCRIDSTRYDNDISPQDCLAILSEIGNLTTELNNFKTSTSMDIRFIKDKLEEITKLNSKGSNADERKENAYKTMKSYKKTPESKPVDIILYKRGIENKQEYINTQLKILSSRREDLLIRIKDNMYGGK